MASTFAFLTDSVSRSSLFRHWALVIVLSSLLSMEHMGVVMVQGEPDMVVASIPVDQLPPSVSQRPNQSAVMEIVPVTNYTFAGSPLVTIPLSTVSRFYQ